MIRPAAVLATCTILSGCAELPQEAIVKYYLPAARIHITVSQTASCGSNNVSTSLKGAAVISYFSSGRPYSLRFNDYSNVLSDMDTTVNTTSDGRLQGINAINTGEAAATAKGAADFSSALQKLILVADMATTGRATPHLANQAFVCPPLLVANGGSATVFYEKDLDFPDLIANPQKSQLPLIPKDSQASQNLLNTNLFRHMNVSWTVRTKEAPLFSAESGPNGADADCTSKDHDTPKTYVCLRNTADIDLSVFTEKTAIEGPLEVLTQTHFVVPINQVYAVPLPKPAPFGKASTKLTLDTAGGLTSIGFSRTSGAAEILEAGAAVAAVATVAATH